MPVHSGMINSPGRIPEHHRWMLSEIAWAKLSWVIFGPRFSDIQLLSLWLCFFCFQLDENNEPTSAILEFCKKRVIYTASFVIVCNDFVSWLQFLQPYVTILGLIGLNPIPTDSTVCRTFFHFMYSFVIFVVICISYTMMYLVSYRWVLGFIFVVITFVKTLRYVIRVWMAH